MTPLDKLAEALDDPWLHEISARPGASFRQREDIHRHLATRLEQDTADR